MKTIKLIAGLAGWLAAWELGAATAFLEAEPVWPAGRAAESNLTVRFEANLQVPAATAAVLRVTGVSAYRIRLNGEFAGYGPARGPHGYHRVDELPLALGGGSNRLELEVAGYNNDSYYLVRQPPFLQAEVLVGGAVIAATHSERGSFAAYPTDRVQAVPRYSIQRNFAEVYQVGAASGATPWPLAKCPVVRYLPRRVPIPEYRINDRVRLTSHGRGVLADAGLNDCGFAMLEVEVKRPGRLVFRFDEILSDGEVDERRLKCHNRVEWELPQPGVYALETFEPYGWRYAEAFAETGEMTVKRVRVREYKSPATAAVRFSCSDPALEKVFAAAQETFIQNSVDVFTDCPTRERAGWLCDSFFIGRVAELLTGNSEYERLFLENYALPESFAALPKGMVPMCYPGDHPNGRFIPSWALFLILETEEYLQRSGDRETVERLRPRILGIIDYLRKFRNEDGLLEKLPQWVFVEWSKANDFVQDVNYPNNMIWAAALESAARIYGLGQLAVEAAAVKAKIREQSFDGQWFRDHAVRGPDGRLQVVERDITETCQYYAFFFGTASRERYPELWQRLVDDFGPGKRVKGVWPANAFIGNYLRLELLSRAARPADIAREVRGYFLYMAEMTGTLWEKVAPKASCSHGFASHAAVSIVRDLVGLKALDRGNRSVVFEPPSGLDLDSIEVTLPAADGELTFGWRRVDGRLEQICRVPAGWKVRSAVNADYPVAFRGKGVTKQPCRISAMPFNEVWRGHQRSLEQTREAYFVQLDAGEEAELRLDDIPSSATVRLFPMSEAGRLRREGESVFVRLGERAQYVVDFGETLPPLHVFVEPPFVYRHVANEIYFGPGEHHAGIIAPTNGQTVCFDRGAVVYGSLFLDQVTNVTVTGQGVLDCSDFTRADPRSQAFRRSRGLPPLDTEFACHACVVYASENVKLEHFVLRDTPLWSLIVRSGSRNVTIDGIKVIGQWRYNSDGIDIAASSDVTVKNCFLRTFDDCMVVLGAYLDTRSYLAENIVFENNVCWCDWGATFKLWSQPYTNTFRNIAVRNCKFLSPRTDPIQVKDTCGSADTRIGDIVFENIEFDYPELPARQLRSEKFERYPGDTPAMDVALVDLYCSTPREDRGNQQFVPIANPVGFRSVISNVTYRNFTFYGVRPHLIYSAVTALDAGQEIKGIKVENLPKFDEYELVGKGVEKPQEAGQLIVHLDFNSVQLKKEAVLAILDEVAAMGYNAVLWEIENKVQWERYPEIVDAEAFTKAEFKEILAHAKRLGLRPIPLLQTLGHGEYVLMAGGHSEWMEDPAFPACYCVSKPEVRKFMKDMIHEYLELFGDEVRDFHLGCDEAQAFCTCAECRAGGSKLQVFVEYFHEITAELRARGVKPGIWCDELFAYHDSPEVKALAGQVTAWIWDYRSDGYTQLQSNHLWQGNAQILEKLGYDLIMASTSESAQDSSYLPRYRQHGANVVWASKVARERGYAGHCVTSWSVHFSPKRTQYALWAAAARAWREAAPDPVKVLDEECVRYFALPYATVMQLTDWEWELCSFQGEQWGQLIKPALPAPPDNLRKMAKLMANRLGEDWLDQMRIFIGWRRLNIRRGLKELAGPKLELAQVLKEGAELQLAFLDVLEAALAKAPLPPLPKARAAKYYALEQSPGSAKLSARITWSNFEGESLP